MCANQKCLRVYKHIHIEPHRATPNQTVRYCSTVGHCFPGPTARPMSRALASIANTSIHIQANDPIHPITIKKVLFIHFLLHFVIRIYVSSYSNARHITYREPSAPSVRLFAFFVIFLLSDRSSHFLCICAHTVAQPNQWLHCCDN